LDEAIGIWRDLRYPINLARAELTRANAAGSVGEVDALSARMRLMGARGTLTARLRQITATVRSAPVAGVAIRCLGGFQVFRAGVPVPIVEWQSKKARDLLKLLVVKRGRPIPREVLAEVLWPDAAPGLIGNRLSVVLATVRSVLDPQRTLAADHYVIGDRGTLRLNLDAVAVDVELFLRDATVALANAHETAELVRLVEVAYAGDFLEEDLLEDWSVALREEARAVYLRVLRTLADGSIAAAEHELAVRYLLRILERDHYDEGAHLDLARTLTRARRHGEARRAYGIYLARMHEIDIEPAAFPV
jgi:DNA-binding SARP family transcriptional activator